jgi:hypothetical protein
MRNILTQRHLTHLLLIDTETESKIRQLTGNCVSLRKRLSDVFYEESSSLISHVYSVVLALPESRTNLIRITVEIEAVMKSVGVNFSVNMVRDEDMFLAKGKVGLLSCSLWRIAGALLLNDVPISPTAIEHILDLANRLSQSGKHLVLRKAGWFSTDFHVGLLASESSVGYLLKGSLSRFSPEHGLEDILKFMKFNCRAGELYLTRF